MTREMPVVRLPAPEPPAPPAARRTKQWLPLAAWLGVCGLAGGLTIAWAVSAHRGPARSELAAPDHVIRLAAEDIHEKWTAKAVAAARRNRPIPHLPEATPALRRQLLKGDLKIYAVHVSEADAAAGGTVTVAGGGGVLPPVPLGNGGAVIPVAASPATGAVLAIRANGAVRPRLRTSQGAWTGRALLAGQTETYVLEVRSDPVTRPR
ncbi:MAG TPA: hypothetical protein DEH78_20580 [Solibacterales bacterium]|nr:hypothetical protein [Bryobacterales bacterium]